MLRKYSVAQAIKVFPVGDAIEKQGTEVSKFKIHKITKLNPDFTYVRFRAIGNLEIDGPNANFDAFPYGEFEDERPNYGYKSFEGKRAFVEHASSNIENSIGSLYGSYLNRFNTSKFGGARWYELQDDQRKDILTSRAADEDGSIEVLMGIDKKLSPSIARMVETDSPTGCSMGTNIDYSECSVCGNRAYYEHQYCFVPGTQILMDDGTTKNIEDVQINDVVITHSGTPQKVLKVFTRDVDEEILAITYRNKTDYTLYVTKNHPILTAKPEQVICDHWKLDYPQKQWCKQGTIKWCERQTCYAKQILPNFECASHLKEGEFLLTPKVLEVRPTNISKKLAKLLGYFVAEGSYLRQGYRSKKTGTVSHKLSTICFSIGYDELNTLGKDIIALCKELFNKECFVRICLNSDTNAISGYEIRCHSTKVAQQFYNLIGEYAKNKKLSSEIIYASPDIQLEFLKGWFEGDGCLSNQVITTSSKDLAAQLSFMLLRQNIVTTPNEVNNQVGYSTHITGDTIFRVSIPESFIHKVLLGLDIKQPKLNFALTENAFLQKISDINYLPYKGKVFNLEVENDNSYIANGVACHNCNHIKYSKGSRVFVPASQLHDLLKKGALRVEWLPYILSRKSDHESVANNDRRMVYANVFEVNYGLSFFELSVVANPAFHRGYKLEKIASIKRGTRQLIPMMITPGKEIEVRLNVSEPYFQSAVNAFSSVIQRPYDDWTNQDKVEFLRDASIAKHALDHGAVEKVLIAQTDVPELNNMGIETSASSDPGFYEVINPDQLSEAKYASIVAPQKLANLQTHYACSWCKQVYAKENDKLDTTVDYGKFSQYSVCPSCAVGVVQREFGDQIFAAETRPTHVLFRDTEKDLFNYNDFEKLVSQGEKPQALVDALYRAAAEHPEIKSQVDEYIPMLQERFGDLASREYPEKKIEGGTDKMEKESKESKKAVYDGLPSTAEDIKDKGIDIQNKELKEYHEGAKIGSELIESEKETRHPGTIFIDLHETKTSFNTLHLTIKAVKDTAKAYLDIAQKIKSKGAYPEMADDMKALPKPDGMGMKPDMGPESKELKELPKPIESELSAEEPEEEVILEDVKEVLDNTIEDLGEVIRDIEGLEPEVAKEEEEIDKAVASVKRWSKKSSENAKSIYTKADESLQEAQAAIKHARKIISNIILQKKVGGTMNKKSDGLTLSDKDLARLASMNAISLKELLAEDKAEKEEKAAEKEEKEAEKEEKAAEKMEEKAEKKEEKAEKKEEKAEKEEKKAAISDYPETVDADKKEGLYDRFEHVDGERKKKDVARKAEAAAMPPTGARDLGDYSHPGGIEKIELTTWWKEMYPQYEQMKAKERRTDFDSPEGKVDILTGVVARLVRKPKAADSYLGILKVAKDGSIVDGLIATFADVAGDNQTAEAYNEFTSPEYIDQVFETTKTTGLDGIQSSLDGGVRLSKIAQMEGIEPGVTDEVNPLYDAYKSEKDSNKPRPGVLLKDHKLADAEVAAFYKEMGAAGDKGYAADMVKKYKKSAEDSEARAKKAEVELDTMKKKEAVKVLAKKAVHLSRVAASKGIIPFDLTNINKQAQEYMILDDIGFRQVKATLDKLPTTNKRALEAYQIPEAEHMMKGVIHNSINAVHTVREEHKAPEEVDVEGIQSAVEENAKLSSEDEGRLRKKAAEVVPQISADPTQGGTIPNFTRRFRTIGNDLRRAGKFEEYKDKLNIRKQ